MNGHNMFALDQARTKNVVGALGEERVGYTSVDAECLRNILMRTDIEA